MTDHELSAMSSYPPSAGRIRADHQMTTAVKRERHMLTVHIIHESSSFQPG
jgi:hypothetical protein